MTKTKNAISSQAVPTSPSSASSVAKPNLPTANAMAPNAPTGASITTICTTPNTSRVTWSSPASTGAARCPIISSADPVSTASTNICSTSPLAKAAKKLSGTMCTR